MIYKADFIQKTHLSLSSKTGINFGENFEFTIVSKKEGFDSLFCVENIKGDFEITKITVTGTSGEFPAIFNKKDKTFSKSIFEKDLEKVIYSFYISANILLKEVCAVNYQFEIPVARLRLLKLYHFFKDEIVLPDYDDLEFKYYVKKIKNHESEGCDIEVEIENPYDVEIEGKHLC
uniref:Uncharacterized protein n=1 Tax=Panagrolaimus davidi TaxID=227884 RepID=A0A914QMN4_9BILA